MRSFNTVHREWKNISKWFLHRHFYFKLLHNRNTGNKEKRSRVLYWGCTLNIPYLDWMAIFMFIRTKYCASWNEFPLMFMMQNFWVISVIFINNIFIFKMGCSGKESYQGVKTYVLEATSVVISWYRTSSSLILDCYFNLRYRFKLKVQMILLILKVL